MLRIGLTGGIASGKSVAARRLASLGAVLVDHDQLARRAVEPGSDGLESVVAAFGPGVVLPDGGLDRPRLAAVIFDDPVARELLESILHPIIHRLAAEADAVAAASDASAVVVHDIPLLVETGQQDSFHVVVVIDAPEELRIRRLVERRGLPIEEATARVAAQLGDDARRAVADIVLDGSGTVENLERQVDTTWLRFVADSARLAAAGS